MARISQEQAQERQAFLLDLFRTQPDISRNDAMDAYKDKFGASLNAKTFNDLREQAQSERTSGGAEERDAEPEADAAPEEAPARFLPPAPELSSGLGAQPAAKKPKAARSAGPRNIFVDATQEQLQFLERVVQQLQEAGANNLRIDHATERWMVLTVDTK